MGFATGTGLRFFGMSLNLYRFLALALVPLSPSLAQEPCPPLAGEEVAAGWRAYRTDSLPRAEQLFAQSDGRCERNLDAKIGLGYVALRQNAMGRADSLFRLVTAADPQNGDGWNGLALVGQRKGDIPAAVQAARRAIAINPADPTAKELLDRLAPGWDRPALRTSPRPRTLQVVARTRGSRFEIPASGGWRPFYIKGMNLGAAVPGKFPSEFPPDSLTYARWIEQMVAMNANTVRLYTILPPEFYRALRAWNRAHPARTLWLIHGVWTELPPEDDFNDPVWREEFRDEMRRVVDLVHGGAEIPARPGHASGRYDADVSRWTLAYIIGREWEPYSVKAFDSANPGLRPYPGRFLRASPAPATDRWMAEQSDFLLVYEVDKYNTIRPIAYTNWPTLDPLVHPTEATTEEEAAWRARAGKPANLVKEYENDAIGLDPSLVQATAGNPAGWFASYHAYPYYPDFLLHDRGYSRARSSEGSSNYFGYLVELIRHHRDIPVVISEYGVPSSRGLAHLQPQGWHHGGLDERDMARIDARLTREIRESGAAGGILFAWIDEWFKKNWVVIDLEIPLENTRQWHNVMDAEQNYGVIGMYAGDSADTPRLGGAIELWLQGEKLLEAASTAPTAPATLHARSNESYLYLSARFPALSGGAFPWNQRGVMIAIDTWLPSRGQHLLPDSLIDSETGFEFLIDLRHEGDGEIRILPEYNPYGAAPDTSQDDVGRFYRRPATIEDRRDGVFDSMYVGTNRARYGRDGTFYPARGVNRGRLRFGTDSASSLSDWYYDAPSGVLQVRIPWGLLNVTDPSTRTILYEDTAGESFGTVIARGFRIGILSYRDGDRRTLEAALPAAGSPGKWESTAFPNWQWKEWTTPTWHSRVKPAYRVMRDTWGRMR
jgi:tetratricopeptide (TPR) repeat protein